MWTVDKDGYVVPDWAESAEAMEREYKSLLKEEYVLTKHGGLSWDRIKCMTQEERRIWMEYMIEEQDKQEKEMRKAKKNG